MNLHRVSNLLGLLPIVIFASACLGRTLDVGEGARVDDIDASDAGADSAVPEASTAEICRDVPIPPASAAPTSIVGTWLLESFDEISSGSPAGQAWHIGVDRARPILAVTFDADGTWRSSSCGGADKYGACDAWCSGALSCKTGTYTYENGKLESKVANGGTQDVYTTAKGITILGFYATLGWSNLVKIDAPIACE